MAKIGKIILAIGVLAGFTGCSSNPLAPDKHFKSKRIAQVVPIPVDIDTELTRVYLKNPKAPPLKSTPPAKPNPGLAAVANESSGSANSPLPNLKNTGKNRGKSNPGRSIAFAPDGGTIRYRVKRGDTLMKISFELFGDLSRWHEISNQNPGKIGRLNGLIPGTLLRIRVTNPIAVVHHGDPYLIRRRDTLIKISSHLYGTPRKWWALWDNNRELIHDPNRIYAGFTLYYRPDFTRRSFTETRGPANQVIPEKSEPLSAAPGPVTEPGTSSSKL